MTRRLMVVLALAGSAVAASAEDGYRHGRVLSVEPGVSLQRATEPGAEEAFPNIPFLPGDRVWTDRAGRAEFQFADGTVLRLDSASKLDYVAHDEGAGDRVILRLWSGGLYLHNRDGRGYPDFGIETPAGVVEARVRGVYRVDAVGGETRLSVYEGEAALQAEREVVVGAGERAYARQGEPTDGPRGFDRADYDDFDRWDGDREERQAYASSRRGYLPEAVLPYAGELDAYGSWYYQSEIGHVWRPYVAAGWRPYFDGRWAWTPYGWTWVSYEPWGWAPFHYGRWGYTPMLGWYWIPGNVWGPAWVSWAYGGDYVGWCPLGYRDRPVIFGGRRSVRGRAVPRGTATATVGGESWTYVRRGDFGASDLAKRAVHTLPAGHAVQAAEHAQARPTRDLHPGAVGTGRVAAPRNVRTRFGPGDTTPELRTDPATTIPFPTARRRARDPEAEPPPPREAAPGTGAPRARPAPLHTYRPAPAAEPATEPAHPTDARRREAAPRDDHAADGDRELMRRVFGPLSQPRSSGPSERPDTHARPSAESERPTRARPSEGAPRHAAPPPRAEPRTEPRSAPAPRAERQERSTPSGHGQSAGRAQSTGRAHAKDKDH